MSDREKRYRNDPIQTFCRARAPCSAQVARAQVDTEYVAGASPPCRHYFMET